MSAKPDLPYQQTFAQKKLAEIRAAQGLKMSKDIQDLYATDIWPERDNGDDFLKWLEVSRGGEDDSMFNLSLSTPEI